MIIVHDVGAFKRKTAVGTQDQSGRTWILGIGPTSLKLSGQSQRAYFGVQKSARFRSANVDRGAQ